MIDIARINNKPLWHNKSNVTNPKLSLYAEASRLRTCQVRRSFTALAATPYFDFFNYWTSFNQSFLINQSSRYKTEDFSVLCNQEHPQPGFIGLS